MSVSFNGVTFPLARTRAGNLPTRDKVVEFPGANGVEVLPMGKGSRDITVATVGGGSLRGTLEALADNKTHTLVVDGDSFGECRCIGVEPAERLTTTDGLRCYYSVHFRQEKPD